MMNVKKMEFLMLSCIFKMLYMNLYYIHVHWCVICLFSYPLLRVLSIPEPCQTQMLTVLYP